MACVMASRRAAQQELAGHAEVHHQAVSGIQFDHDELAAPVHAANPPAGQHRAHLVRIAAQDARAGELGRDDAPAHNPGDRSHHGFDFGKFRHVPALRAGCRRLPPAPRKRGTFWPGSKSLAPVPAVPFPGVPGADHVMAVQRALAQRSAAVQAGSADRGDAPAHIAEGVWIAAHHDFGDRIGGQLRKTGDFDQGHLSRLAQHYGAITGLTPPTGK